MPELKEGPKAELPRGLTLRSTLEVQAGNINEIAWSPDGATLASGDPDGVIGLWDVESGIQRARLERTERVVWSVAFAPSGGHIASGSNDGSIGIYETQGGRLEACLERHESWVRSVAWSPDGTLLASGANDRRIMVWDVASRSQRCLLEAHRERVLSLRFSPDGSKIASAGGDGLVVIWDVASGEETARQQISRGWQRAICWSPDGRLVATGGEDGALRLLRSHNGRLTSLLEGHREGIGALSFEAGGELLASRSVDGQVRLWTPSRGSWRELARFKEPASFPMANMAFHPREPLLASVAQSRIRIWQIGLEALRSSEAAPPATRLHTSKVVVLSHAPAAELAHALATPLPLDTYPAVHLLDARDEESGGRHERHEILLVSLDEVRPENRELAALHLRGADAVVVVFDPACDTDPGDAIRHYAALAARVARAEKRTGGVPLFAVATQPLGRRGDTSAIAAGGLDLAQLELPLCGLFVVRPSSPRAVQRLHDALLEALHEALHEALPEALADATHGVVLESSAALAGVAALIEGEKRHGRLLATTDDLFRQHLGQGEEPEPGSRVLFEACLHQLELRGQVRRLRLGQLIAFPRLVEAYGRALMRQAKGHPRGLGALREEEALEGELTELDEAIDAKELDHLLRTALLVELVELGIAFKGSLGGEPWLVFPSLFGSGCETLPAPWPPSLVTESTIELAGPVDAALAGLVFRLAEGHTFELERVYRDGATFSGRLGGHFTLHLEKMAADRGRLHLAASAETSDELRRHFASAALADLERASAQITALGGFLR